MSKPCCFRRWFTALALLITNDITLHLCSGRRTVLLAYIKGCITGATCRKLLIQTKKVIHCPVIIFPPFGISLSCIFFKSSLLNFVRLHKYLHSLLKFSICLLCTKKICMDELNQVHALQVSGLNNSAPQPLLQRTLLLFSET